MKFPVLNLIYNYFVVHLINFSQGTSKMTGPLAKLAVLETVEWDTKSLFKVFVGPGEFDFDYATFIGRSSFEENFSYYANKQGIRCIQISCHGRHGNKAGKTGELIGVSDYIDSADIERVLRKKTQQKGLGIHFGACEYAKTAKELCEVKGVNWVSGYHSAVDWYESAAFESLFWPKILDLWKERATGESTGLNLSTSEIKKVLEDLHKACGTLMEKLEFSVYVKHYREVIDLTEEIYKPDDQS